MAGPFDDLDKQALMQQLGGMKDRAPSMGENLGVGASGIGAKLGLGGARGGGLPTSNAMPIRERAPINDQVAATPSPLPAPPTSAEAPTQLLDQQQPDMGAGIGALANMLKQRPPDGAAMGVPLQPRPMPMRPQTRNPLAALGALFGRRR